MIMAGKFLKILEKGMFFSGAIFFNKICFSYNYTSISLLSCISLETKVICFGGYTGNEETDEIFQYYSFKSDFGLGPWFKSNYYLHNNCNTNFEELKYTFTHGAAKWTKIGTLKQGRSSHSAIAYNGTVMIIGGWGTR